MRKNARANRERILAAAEAVFGASGELGSTEDVAGRAGVGIATVFRHFPTKDALIEATLIRQFDRLDEQATRLAGEPDPGRAVRELIVTLIETSSTKLTLISLVGEPGRLLGEPVELPDQRRLDERVFGGEVAEHGGDADRGPGGDVLGRAELAAGSEDGLGRGQDPLAVGSRVLAHRRVR